ncbi:MAG: CopD family protein [Armatimonadota bacterium]|nr:CopD family protein [Armatimonadota bacterium]MDR7568255.1 CopD family protein [Armatimonadota bacterium]MDR7602261.1 CopD family protein [Armatimonadota bacterium]
MTSPRAILGGICLMVLVGLLAANPARGHAVLLRSSPPDGARLDTSPPQAVLVFSEPVHPALSTAEVLDSSGRVRSLRSEVTGDGRTLVASLPQLPRGSYAVRWRILSRVDGHLTTGLVAFGVGVEPGRRGMDLNRPPLLRVAVRWVAYAAMLVLAGISVFRHLVFPTALPKIAENPIRTLTGVAALVLLLTAPAELAYLLGGAPFQQAAWMLASSSAGLALGLRSLAASAFLVPDAARARWSLPAAAVLLFTATLSSHAWGGGMLAALVDGVHLLAASVWLGGLAGLLVLLAAGRPYRMHAVQAVLRFSWWAGWSLMAVAGSGALMTARELPFLSGLLTTDWGRLLLAKLVLVLILVILGAVNRYALLPRLTPGNPKEGVLRWVRRVVTVEAAAGALVLLVVGALTITPTARAIQLRTVPPRTLALAAVSGGLRIVLRVMPAEPGWNRFEATLRSPEGTSGDADRVMVRLWKLDEEVLPATVRLTREEPGRYATESGALGLPGFWEAEVVLRWRGRPDVSVSFPLRVGEFRLRTEAEAFQLLRRAREAMEAVHVWRETEQITDGAGNVVVTRYTFQKPDRVRFEVAGGMEAILISRERYVRTDRGWSRDRLPEPFMAQGAAGYMQNPARAQVGRRAVCGEEPCRVVLWDSPDGLASFAAWIGERTHRPHKLLMSAPAHYMVTLPRDFDAAQEVTPP